MVATANRREGVYNRVGEPSVTFCGKGGAAKQTNTPSKRWGIVSGACSDVEAPPRLELGNEGFADLCLTTWLWRHIGGASAPHVLERKTRFELATFALARRRSTTEPLPHAYIIIGAGERT